MNENKFLESLQKIQRAKNEWEATADSLRQLVFLIDENEKIIRANRTIEKWNLGLVTSIAKRSVHDVLHPVCMDPTCYLTVIWPMAKKNLQHGQPFEYMAEDPVLKRFLNIEFRPIFAPNKSESTEVVSFAIASFEDISEHKQTEKQLRQRTAEFDAIFQALPDHYCRISADGTILDLDYGHSADFPGFFQAKRGEKIQLVFPESIGIQYEQAIKRVTRTQSPVTIQYRLDIQESEQIFEARFVPLLENQMIIINRNTTETVQLESIAQSIEMTNNFGYIFSGIRHEIGNPINSIKMTMSVMRNNIKNYDQTMILEYIERVLAEVNRVEYLLRLLKNFNMLEHLNPEKGPVKPYLDNFLMLIREDYERLGIEISVHYETGEESACFDPRALHQVLLNLMNNAADALEKVEDKKISLTIRERRNRLEIRIEDNGCGMTLSQQRALFKPFFTSKSKGSGFGLVMVKKLLSNMNGTVEVDSHENRGTRITITLPVRDHETA